MFNENGSNVRKVDFKRDFKAKKRKHHDDPEKKKEVKKRHNDKK